MVIQARRGRRLISALLFVVNSQIHAQRAPVEGRHGMVASASAIASSVGVEVLRGGGNAIDAAVAVGLALAVTYPRAGNLGGGGFMMIALADGRTAVIDYREVAPAAATRTMYLGSDGKVVPGLSLVGHKAAGVPGTVAGLALALEKYGSGKMTWAQLTEPARRLAAEGFAVPQGLAADLRPESRILSRFTETKRVYLRDGRGGSRETVFGSPIWLARWSGCRKEGHVSFTKAKPQC